MRAGPLVWKLVIGVPLFALPQVGTFLGDSETIMAVFGWTPEVAAIAQYWIFGICIVLFIAGILYEHWKRAKSRSEVWKVSEPIKHMLSVIVREYSLFFSGLGKKAVPVIRVNLMLPTRRRFSKDVLRIYFATSNAPARGYTIEEERLQWRKGVGCCGEAMEHGKPVIFDSSDPRYGAPLSKLNTEQKRLTNSLGSVLSFPVRHPECHEVLAVLNFDSEKNISSTFFHDQHFIAAIEPFVSQIGHILHEYLEGVTDK